MANTPAQLERQRRYREKNRKTLRVKNREYQARRRAEDPEYVERGRQRIRDLGRTNPEQLSEIRKRSYAKHAEKRRAERRAYYHAHPEEAAASSKRHYELTRETRLEEARTYRLAHPETCRAAQRRWRAANPERRRMYDAQRRARKAQAEGSYSPAEFAWLCRLLGHRCFYCERPSEALEADHAIPLSRGGANHIGNIVPACKPCNSSKRDSTPTEFLARKGWTK